MLRTFGGLRRGVIFGSEEGRFLAILLWIVGTGFNFHLRVHRFLRLMYCSWNKCFHREKNLLMVPMQFRLLTNFIHFSRRSFLAWGKWKDAIFWSSICVFSSRASKNCTLVGHSMYHILSSTSQIQKKKLFFNNYWFIICINCVNMIRN